MKIFKIFALAAMMFGMVACDDGYGDGPLVDPELKSKYNGTVSVMSGSSPYNTENIEVEVIPCSNDAVDIAFYKIKFVPQMPVKINLRVPNVPITRADNGVINLAGNNIVPLFAGGPYEDRIVTNLVGTITNTTIELSLNFGDTPTTYKGTKK